MTTINPVYFLGLKASESEVRAADLSLTECERADEAARAHAYREEQNRLLLVDAIDVNGARCTPQGWRGPYKPNPWGDLRPIDDGKKLCADHTFVRLCRSLRVIVVVELLAGVCAMVAIWWAWK